MSSDPDAASVTIRAHHANVIDGPHYPNDGDSSALSMIGNFE